MPATIRIVVRPGRTGSPAAFDAFHGDRWLCMSETPFLDAARRLVAEGTPADTTLEMWHAGAKTWSLRASAGKAAALTVRDDDDGLRFRKWEPYRGPCR